MLKREEKTQGTKASRRSFMKGAGLAAVGGVAVAGLATPNIARAQTKTIKMQAAWGGGIFLENARNCGHKYARCLE